MTYAQRIAEAIDYYDLCDRARAVGIDTTATDETAANPYAVAELEAETVAAEIRLLELGA